MTIPSSFLDQLRDRTSLSTIIQRASVPLKKAGREWKAPCPFHNEKTPSFYVNDEKAFYHCFGCGAHGDVIRWLVDHEGMTFIDAVKQLAELAGLDVPAQDPRDAERAKRRDSHVDIMARAQRFFASMIAPDQGVSDEARRYLSARGISSAMIERWGIGFAPLSRVGQPSHVATALKDVDVGDLDLLGLVKRNPDSNAAYDFFRGRIIIPIHDARGGVIGFGGRALGDAQPKYLNSPDSPVFDKGRSLYNIHRAAPGARAKNRLLIVEGYMDVIGLDSVGFDCAVAPNGTALTEHQLFIAWKLVDSPTVCFDGDAAGRRAAARAAYRALPVMEPGKTLRFAFPPDGKDPDDLAREAGLESVNAMVDAAIPLVDVIWRDKIERFEMRDPDQRAALSAEIKATLRTIANEDVRSAYAAAFRDRLDRDSSRTQAAGAHKARGRGRNVAAAVEAALILGCVDQPTFLRVHGAAIGSLKWLGDDTKRLAGLLEDLEADGGEISRETVLSAIEAAGMTEFVAYLRSEALQLPFSREKDPERADKLLFDALRANFN